MSELIIKSTAQTPEIIFNSEQGELKLTGKSYPENVNETYAELFSAIKDYSSNPQKKTTLSFDWLYYNTATSKIIIKVISELLAIETLTEINWHIQEGFDMMIEKAELISEIMGVKINILKS